MFIGGLLPLRELDLAQSSAPEEELLIATLYRAVLEYVDPYSTVDGEAERWLFGSSDPQEAFSFTWICEQLKLDPSAMRRRVRQLWMAANNPEPVRWGWSANLAALPAVRNENTFADLPTC